MQKAGKYEILRKIGAGGFGVVFEGRDPFIKRRVAIKTCTSEDDDIRQRFFREAEIAGNLQHKNIVTIHDFGFEEGVPYLVQEFLPGEDLSQMIARREELPLGRKLDILLQAAHGMAFAHGQGVIHRDIKPNNVRVLEDWRVKIMDFGIAKLANVESHLTKEGMTVGTAAYLPPEQIRGDKVDTRADIFSFGVLAYELLTYTRPFDGKTLSTLLFQILSQEPKPLQEVWPEASPRLARLVASCLEKDAAKRCPTFEMVASEIATAVAEMSVSDETNLIAQQTRNLAQVDPKAEMERTELAAVGDKVRNALAAGDLTAAELELTLAEKSWGRNPRFNEVAAPLRSEISRARERHDEEHRRAEKLRHLLARGDERLQAGEFAEARVAFEAALDVDSRSETAREGVARADAGLAWQAAEATRAAQATELARAGADLLAQGDPQSALSRARQALELAPDLTDAIRLRGDAEARLAALAEEEQRRRDEERRAAAAAEAERRRIEEAERLERKRKAEEEAQRRKAEAEAEAQRKRAEAEAEAQRRKAEAEAEARRLSEEQAAAARARRLQEAGDEIEAAIARGALPKAEKILVRAERELGAEPLASWRERWVAASAAASQAAAEARAAEQEALRAAAAEREAAAEAKRQAQAAKREAAEHERAIEREREAKEREAKRVAAEEASRRREEERERARLTRSDLARAKSLEATAGTQLPTSSFASAKLTDPQTLKWVGAAAASLAVVAVVLWFALGRRGGEVKTAATSSPSAASPVQTAPADESKSVPQSSRPSATPPPSETQPIAVPPPAPAPNEIAAEPAPATPAPAEPSPAERATDAVRARLAAGDRPGALAQLADALRSAPSDAGALALVAEMESDATRRAAAARQRGLAAGADRLASTTYARAEKELASGSSTTGSDAIRSSWRAAELFDRSAKEAREAQRQLEAAAKTPVQVPQAERPAAPVPAPPTAPTQAPAAQAPTTEPALPAPVETKPAPSAADPTAEVRATLERYRAAYESLDASALAAVWTLDDTARRQIEKAFAGYNSLSMTFDRCGIDVRGDAATARCRVIQRVDVRVGSDIRSTQDVSFELKKVGERWAIRSRTAK